MSKSFETREFIPFKGNQFGLVYADALTENAAGADELVAFFGENL